MPTARSARRRNRRPRVLTSAKETSRPSRSPAREPFASTDEILEAMAEVIRAREAIEPWEWVVDAQSPQSTVRKARQLAEGFHARFAASRSRVPFADRCCQLQLQPIEIEAVLATALGRMGMVSSGCATLSEITELLRPSHRDGLALMRSIISPGRLAKSELLILDEDEDNDEELRERNLQLDVTVIDELVYGGARTTRHIDVRSEKDLHRWLRKVTAAIARYAELMAEIADNNPFAPRSRRYHQAMRQRLSELHDILNLHPTWGLSRLLAEVDRDRGREIILLALVGKALAHLPADHDLFTGEHLVGACTRDPLDYEDGFAELTPAAPLVRSELIRPCQGTDSFVSDRPDDLKTVEFELGERALTLLGVERCTSPAIRRAAGLRGPKMRLDQLVLSDAVNECLSMALVQARQHRRLMDEWGLGRQITYGRAVTLLFEGPPGVGKTAAAEALAAELDRHILVVDYSKIQGCFVGETEKRIVKTFRNAARHGAVLFWDEADAMFFNRDASTHSWEVRDVNVLLQELERFEGVCVLATNRKVSLDPALERRISLKVRFDRPDAAMRAAIWRKLLPETLPLAEDVDLAELSAADLSGGQIKNALLNAARRALCRGEDSVVSMADFRHAVQSELDGALAADHRPRIGFRTAAT